ncbi:MAG: MCE family protein [Mycobacteriaceae bacterium]
MKKKRSPAVTGFVGALVIIMATVSAFFLGDLPLVGAGTKYTAEFTEAAGLRPDNEVRVAGVKVGKVTSVALAGDRVKVQFRVKDTWVGDRSTASIQIKTILGQKYLALDPQGSNTANPKDIIGRDRTTSPYDVIEAFSDASKTLGDIDTDQLANSMRTLSAAFQETPENVRASLDGVTRLSVAIGSRDDDLRKLLAATADVSKILADRNDEFQRLISNGAALLSELNDRQKSIAALLDGTKRVSVALRGIVADNEAQIGPMLDSLQTTVDLLNKNQDNIRKSLNLMAPFYRIFTNVLGNGRWFESVVTNILPPGLPEVPGYREPVRDLSYGGTR